MEISKELQDAINEQLNFELYSGYIYLSMAAYFEENLLDGMAHWMRIQAKEEYEHAERFWKFIAERGGRVVLAAIAGPKTEWASPLAAWEDAYNHELEVTKRINKIGEIAENEKDRATMTFLNWFYNEQVEEEEQTLKVVDLLKKIGDSTNALFMLDAQLGRREG